MSTNIYQIASLSIENDRIKKVTDTKNIIIALCCLLLSVALVGTSPTVSAEQDTLIMIMLTAGGLLFVCSIYLFINKSTKFVYAPTNSALKSFTCYIDSSQLVQAERWASNGFKSNVEGFVVKADGNTRVDILLSEDRKFAAIQLSVYENFRYDPCCKIGYLYDDEVESVKSLVG